MRAAPLPIRTRGPIDAHVRCPGSKSITNRALLIAALAEGESVLSNPLESDDTVYMSAALEKLGAKVAKEKNRWRITGTGGKLRTPTGTLDVHASGTAARFLTAVATLSPGPAVVDGVERIRQRPVSDLVEALRSLGAQIDIEGQLGCPPVRALGGGIEGGEARIDASQSSQYVSAVLLTAPYARNDVALQLAEGRLVSRPYVELTMDCMRAFGAEVDWKDEETFHVRAGATYRGRDYAIEPDASTAAYFFAAAAITGGRACVEGLPGNSIQADVRLLDIFERMGCRVERSAKRITLTAPSPEGGGLCGVDVDMNALPDAVLAFSVVAAFAKGQSVVRNVGNLRITESDRLAALETELNRIGAHAESTADTLRIEPAPLHGAEIETYDDHRVAMAFGLVGLRVPGIRIKDPGCVSKSWPEYFDALEKL